MLEQLPPKGGAPERLTSNPNWVLTSETQPSTQPTPPPLLPQAWEGAPGSRRQSSPPWVLAKRVGVPGPGLGRRRDGSATVPPLCVSEHSPLGFLPPPLPLHKHPASQGSPARLPTLCLIFHAPDPRPLPALASTTRPIPQDPSPMPPRYSPTTPPRCPTTPPCLPRPRPPARENRKGPAAAAAALEGSAGSGGGCGAYLGPQPDPWPRAPRRPGRGRGGGRRTGLLTWRGALAALPPSHNCHNWAM